MVIQNEILSFLFKYDIQFKLMIINIHMSKILKTWEFYKCSCTYTVSAKHGKIIYKSNRLFSYLAIISRWGPYWVGDVPDMMSPIYRLALYFGFDLWRARLSIDDVRDVTAPVRPSSIDCRQLREKSIKFHIMTIPYWKDLFYCVMFKVSHLPSDDLA